MSCLKGQAGLGPATDREKVAGGGKKLHPDRKMKALLLLILPWLSPANYVDNVGNLLLALPILRTVSPPLTVLLCLCLGVSGVGPCSPSLGRYVGLEG